MSEQNSLEASMRELAQSNNRLAEANDRYTNAIGTYLNYLQGGGEPTHTLPSAPAAPATKRGKASKSEPAAATKAAAPSGDELDDGLGDGLDELDEPTVPAKITEAMFKEQMMKVKTAYGDKSYALAVIGKKGYKTLGEVKPEDYKFLWAEADKSIANAPNA